MNVGAGTGFYEPPGRDVTAGGTGLATMVNGWHRASDVAAAMLVSGRRLGLLAGLCRRLLLLSQLHRYDYIFIHREATPLGPPWFECDAGAIR